jgi:hypothetical protein
MPSPSPSPSVLDYVQHVSAVADNGLAVLVACAVLVVVSLGILVARSFA